MKTSSPKFPFLVTTNNRDKQLYNLTPENLFDWERMTIADALQEVTFGDGDLVIKQGDEGEDFYIILEG